MVKSLKRESHMGTQRGYENKMPSIVLRRMLALSSEIWGQISLKSEKCYGLAVL